jgi:hypothetical protein
MSKLNAHFEKMQGMATQYLMPATYVALYGMMATHDDHGLRDKLFIADMIYMLDGPEQRDAQTLPASPDEGGAA